MNWDTIRLVIPQADHTYLFEEERTEFDAADVKYRHYGLYRCPKCKATVGGPSLIGTKNAKTTVTLPREGCPTEWEWNLENNKWIKKPDPLEVALRNFYGPDFHTSAIKNNNGTYTVSITIPKFESSYLYRLDSVRTEYLHDYKLKILSIKWKENIIEDFDLTRIKFPVLEIILGPTEPTEDKE